MSDLRDENEEWPEIISIEEAAKLSDLRGIEELDAYYVSSPNKWEQRKEQFVVGIAVAIAISVITSLSIAAHSALEVGEPSSLPQKVQTWWKG